MASIGFLTRGSMINALAFSESNFCSVGYLNNRLIKSKRDTIERLARCNKLK